MLMFRGLAADLFDNPLGRWSIPTFERHSSGASVEFPRCFYHLAVLRSASKRKGERLSAEHFHSDLRIENHLESSAARHDWSLRLRFSVGKCSNVSARVSNEFLHPRDDDRFLRSFVDFSVSDRRRSETSIDVR